MKKGIILFGLIGCFGHAVAQDVSLEQVLAGSRKQEVFQADRQVEIEAIKLKIQQSKRIPLIFGEANVQRNLIRPVTPVPAVAFNPNAPSGEITPLRFATNWSAKAGVQLSFDVFNPETEAQIREAKLSKQKAAIQQKDANRSADNEIRDLYAQVVLAQEQVRVAKEVADQYMQTLQVVKDRYEAGRASEVEFNNTLKKGYELEQLEEEAALVLLNKKIALLPYADIDLNARFTTPLEDIIRQISNEQSTSETESLAIDKQINDLKIKNIGLQAIPKLTFNAYLGSQFYNNDFRLFNSDYWYGVSYVNLALRIPITEVFERNLTRKQLILEGSVLESKLQVSNGNDSVARLQKENQILVLRQKVITQEKIVKLSEANVGILKAQVDEGTQLITELNKELESYLDQQKRMWQAQYDLLQKLAE